MCQQRCLQFLSPYCITVCVCARKAVYSSSHHTSLQCVCAQGCLQFLSPYCIAVWCQQGSVQFLSPYCIAVCVCQQGSVEFLSPYCIAVCVPARLSAVPVTILHYSVCASKALYSSCHHTALQCVYQQGPLQFLSP